VLDDIGLMFPVVTTTDILIDLSMSLERPQPFAESLLIGFKEYSKS
jgi:hypothetical protein